MGLHSIVKEVGPIVCFRTTPSVFEDKFCGLEVAMIGDANTSAVGSGGIMGLRPIFESTCRFNQMAKF